MSSTNRRMLRELKTVEAMIALYCHAKHGSTDTLCPRCRDLMTYARRRLDACTYGEKKPTCARCPIHCYRAAMRSRIRAVMRYAGPRMLLRHPVLALGHLADGLRRAPAARR